LFHQYTSCIIDYEYTKHSVIFMKLPDGTTM